MLSIKQKLSNLINFARDKSCDFVYSYYFPMLISAIALLFWLLDLQMIGVSILVFITCLVFIFLDDFLPIIPLMFIIPMCFRNAKVLLAEEQTLTIVFCSALFLSLVIHLFRYSIKITLDGFFYTLLGVLLIFLLGGIFSGDYANHFETIDIFLISAVTPLAIHFFFFNKIKLDENRDYRRYFCFCFICAVALACLQLCYALFYKHFIGKWTLGSLPGGVSWANTNHVANLILLAVPLCFYMMTSSKGLTAWFILLAFFYTTIALSKSHGGLATLAFFTPVLMCASYQFSYKSNRKFLIWAFVILIVSAILVLTYFYLYDYTALVDFIKTSSSGNGRDKIYEQATNIFANHPILGIGFGNGKLVLPKNANGFFHSSFFHILACAGIVGIAFYIFYYIVRFKYLTKNNSLIGKFALISFFMFGVYGIIENNEFNIVLTFMTTMITAVGLFNKKGSDDMPLPLYMKNPKF